MKRKKIIFGIILFIGLIIGLVVAFFITQQSTDIRQQASVTERIYCDETYGICPNEFSCFQDLLETRPYCAKVCESNNDCELSQDCYQPPMPECPEGQNCAQVMPQKICKIVETKVGEGESCSEGQICESGLICNQIQTFAAGGPTAICEKTQCFGEGESMPIYPGNVCCNDLVQTSNLGKNGEVLMGAVTCTRSASEGESCNDRVCEAGMECIQPQTSQGFVADEMGPICVKTQCFAEGKSMPVSPGNVCCSGLMETPSYDESGQLLLGAVICSDQNQIQADCADEEFFLEIKDQGIEGCFLIGDFDLDNKVNSRDYALLTKDFGKIISSYYDLNNDGQINSRDYALFMKNYGKSN